MLRSVGVSSSEKPHARTSESPVRAIPEAGNKVREELDKCMLLCANCHREIHAELQLPQETVVATSGEFRGACPESPDSER